MWGVRFLADRSDGGPKRRRDRRLVRDRNLVVLWVASSRSSVCDEALGVDVETNVFSD